MVKEATVSGRIDLPPPPLGMTSRQDPLIDIRVVLWSSEGWRLATFCLEDGRFELQGVPPGTFLMEVEALGWIFPTFRVDISAKTGHVQLSQADTRGQVVMPPHVIPPLSVMEYYQQRKPFNPLNMLKGPQGIMIAVVLGAIFLLPKVNPEELKAMQAEYEQ